ncbi:MAG TPA: universal stress protein [Rugosimonospora sp.]|jgi:nucleotide-binding universal stress UspA family protein
MTTAAGFDLGPDGPGTLVVGVDGSDTSWRALYYAFGVARRQHATVLAVFAVPTPIAFGNDGIVVGAIAEANEQLADELRPAIQTLAVDFRVRAEFICRVGDPGIMLVQVAQEHHADALIVGASQALIHQVFPSNAIRAVRRCRCPVTVVP